MREWPRQHRNLAGVVVFLLLAYGGVYLFVVRPKDQEVADARGALQETREKLQKTGWPLEAERLGRLLEDMEKNLEGPRGKTPGDARSATGIKRKAELILKDATTMFAPRIGKLFPSSHDFVNEVSLLDYQEEFAHMERRFRNDDVVLAKDMLGLWEDTSSPYTYQLLLQIWTLDELVGLALKNELKPVKTPLVRVNAETGARQASQLTVLPVRAYFLDPEDKDPYVLEFPVRLTLAGRLSDFCNFLSALHRDGRFLPVSRMELKTDSPAGRPRLDRDGNARVDHVEVDLECSSFFRLQENTPVQRVHTERMLPRGS